ncbi:hypothetical protein RJC24_08210 [Staphylococcus epidermidis]|nr:hypothetical protein [Staphylococcus epidermidis]MDS3929395.1 hypothetical protein [Staphylococcus epidermidis]
MKEVHAEYLTPHQIGRNIYAQRTVGRKERLPDDDGYHLITQTFGGSIYFTVVCYKKVY